MRAAALTLVLVLALGDQAPHALAQSRATLQETEVAPSPSASPGDRGADRGRSPGFVALLLLLGAALLWQFQRARRTTAEMSARSLDDLERTLRAGEDRDKPEV